MLNPLLPPADGGIIPPFTVVVLKEGMVTNPAFKDDRRVILLWGEGMDEDIRGNIHCEWVSDSTPIAITRDYIDWSAKVETERAA